MLKREGFEALGTSSLAVALALGRQDGAGEVSRNEALANAILLSKLIGLPGYIQWSDEGVKICRCSSESSPRLNLIGLIQNTKKLISFLPRLPILLQLRNNTE